MGYLITRAELAEEVGRMGFATTGWIHEVMALRENWNKPVPIETVAAFLASFRKRLDSIEARAGINTSDTPTT